MYIYVYICVYIRRPIYTYIYIYIHIYRLDPRAAELAAGRKKNVA